MPSRNGSRRKRQLTFDPRECARKGCDVVFTPTNGRQRFHSVECRREAEKATRNGTPAKRRAPAETPDLLGALRRNCDRELAAAGRELEQALARRERAALVKAALTGGA